MALEHGRRRLFPLVPIAIPAPERSLPSRLADRAGEGIGSADGISSKR